MLLGMFEQLKKSIFAQTTTIYFYVHTIKKYEIVIGQNNCTASLCQIVTMAYETLDRLNYNI